MCLRISGRPVSLGTEKVNDTMSELEEDAPCPKCLEHVSIEAGYERPEHGLCWECSSEEVTFLRKRLLAAGVLLKQAEIVSDRIPETVTRLELEKLREVAGTYRLSSFK